MKTSQPDSPVKFDFIKSHALSILAVLAILTTLSLAKTLVVPIFLAILISLLMSPLVRWMNQRLHLSSALGAGLILSSLAVALAVVAWFSVPPASAWLQTVPSRMPEIQYRLRTLIDPLKKVSEATKQVENLTTEEEKPVVQLKEQSLTGLLMNQTPFALANLFVMVVLIYFMLASGDVFLRKLVRFAPTFQDRRRAVNMVREVEKRISLYLRTITLINLCLGTAVALAAYFVGLPNFFLWGVLAFILNYVPYLGAFIGIVSTFLVGMLSFTSTSYALLMPGIYFVLNLIEGNFITPSIMSRILTLNPVIVFISLLFWGWMWGLIGVLLAVPILAIFKIVCDHTPGLEPWGLFLGQEDRGQSDDAEE